MKRIKTWLCTPIAWVCLKLIERAVRKGNTEFLAGVVQGYTYPDRKARKA